MKLRKFNYNAHNKSVENIIRLRCQRIALTNNQEHNTLKKDLSSLCFEVMIVNIYKTIN